MKRPTILDVARESGVAKSTVSVVLNATPAAGRVPPETQKRVRAAAGKLGYRPSWRARMLTTKRSQMVGVLYTPPMPVVARGNYEGILSGVNEVLHARGYQMLMMPLGDNPAEWKRELAEQRIDGAIVLSRLLPQLAEIIISTGMPATLVNAETDFDFAKVLPDDYGGSRESVEYLLSLGHQRVVFFLGKQPDHFSIDRRVQAYKDVMAAAGLEGFIRVDESTSAAEFADWYLKTPAAHRPTAVICYTHYLAIKLLQQFWLRNVTVPADISVSCFSNAYPVEDVIPPLTTVALQTEQMGRTAAEMMLEQIESKQQAARRSVVLKSSLVVRQSTAAPPSSSATSSHTKSPSPRRDAKHP